MKPGAIYRAAVIVHTINSLLGIVLSFPTLMQGPGAQTITAGVPQIVIVLTTLLGVAGLVSAYGAWRLQKWGIALTIVIEAISGLLALPGILFAPTIFGRIASTISVLVAVFIIFALLQQPRSKNGQNGSA